MNAPQSSKYADQAQHDHYDNLGLKGIPAIGKLPLSSRKTAKYIADCASEKKAMDILILDMRSVANFCDYFVICSGNTDRQVKAIADFIGGSLEDVGLRVQKAQGLNKAEWVVFDSGDVVTHIFQKELRTFYNLEHLWQEAKQVEWTEPQTQD